jgi:hypothetical protein
MKAFSGAKGPVTLSVSVLAALAAAAPAAAAPVQQVDLELVGRTTPPGGANQAEIAAFDPETNRVFTTNATSNSLDIYDFSNPTAPGGAVDSISLAPFGGGPNSVAVHDGLVAVAVEGATPQAIGTVQFFDTDGVRLGSVRAGALPDMLTFTKDGDYLLVANEGEPEPTLGIVDPEGSVTVIDMRRGLDDLIVRQASFHGVPLRGPVRLVTEGTTAAQDLEPEYIATSRDTAYVAIQEANAVGILDIPRGRFEVVRSLRFKDWSEASLDTSNGDDGGPLLRSWENLLGMYQPDAIASYRLESKGKVRCKRGKHKGEKKCRKPPQTFIATANEGDVRDWDFFSEEVEVGALTLDPDAFAADAGNPEMLGELKVTSTQGDTDGDGDYDRLYAFGGRSMSILDSKGNVAFDTGGELEELSQSLDAGNFNKSNTAGSPVDNRSDDKGPEPEALAIGRVGGRQYAFVGAERSGGIYAYDLEARRGQARFADGYVNTREDDLGPEGALFIPASQSPNGSPLVLFTYEVSSTVAAYEVIVE